MFFQSTRRLFAAATTPAAGKFTQNTESGATLKASVTFMAHTPQILDLYVSFARQAAQAMTIVPSKTIYPVQTHPSQWKTTESTAERVKDEQNRPLTPLTANQSYEHTRMTVNRSPFVHGRHQDQFEIRTYKRLLELYDADSETIKRWLHYVSTNLPFGVGVDYTIHEYETLPSSAKPGAESLKDE